MSYLKRIIGSAVLAVNAGAQDTTRIRVDGAPLWGENVRLVQEVRIGSVSGPPEYALGGVADVAAFPDGTFFIYDQTDLTIRRYDAAGRYVGAVARKGSGPGEILDGACMRTLGDSLLIVWDPANSRVSLFDRVGKRLREFPVVHPRITLGRDGFAVDPTGYVAIHVSTPAKGGVTVSAPTPSGLRTFSTPPLGGTIQSEYWMRYSMAGTLVDSVRADRIGPFRRPLTVGRLVNFTDRPVAKLLSGGGVITGWPDDYRLALPGQNGRRLVIERAFRPIPIAGEEREEWLAVHASLNPKSQFGSSNGGWYTPEQLVSRDLPPYQLPETKPGFVDFEVDPLGRIWVELYTTTTKHVLPLRAPGDNIPRISWSADPVYEVFDPAGRFLGRVALPRNSTLLAIQRNRVWLKSEGPDGEPVVAVYRIVGPRGP